MIFQQFRNEGCLSYLIGDEKGGACAVIDPAKDIVPYRELIENKNLTLTHVIDTHSHADHVTGAGKLAEETGAALVMGEHVDKQRRVSKGKGDDMGIGDILRENALVKVTKKVNEGNEIRIGRLGFTIIDTPGHTQDAMCLLMNDRVFTGDTLMIGLCGRTDLPGGSAEMMYDSIFGKLFPLRDDLLVYPAHDYRGNINSALGYEKVNNPFLKPRNLEDFLVFVKQVFPPPKGAGVQCGVMEAKVPVGTSATGPLMNEMCIAMERLFKKLPDEWKQWNLITVSQLKKKLEAQEKVFVLDVRTPEEFREYHIKGAKNIPVKELSERVGELPPNKGAEIVTHCESGFRSAHAAIFLKAFGYTNVKNLELGIHEWREEGYKVERSEK